MIRCSICFDPLPHKPAYRNVVCKTCDEKAVNAKGRKVLDLGLDDGENPVYINGQKCWRRYRIGGHVTMLDDLRCATWEEFFDRNLRVRGDENWALMEAAVRRSSLPTPNAIIDPIGPFWQWKSVGETGKLALWKALRKSRRRQFEASLYVESDTPVDFGGTNAVCKEELIVTLFTPKLGYVFFTKEDEEEGGRTLALLVQCDQFTPAWARSFARQAEKKGDTILSPRDIMGVPNEMTWFGGEYVHEYGGERIIVRHNFR